MSFTDRFQQGIDKASDILSSLANTVPTIPEDFKNGLIDDLAQSKYNFNYLVFPNDLGMDDVGHYMVININVPTKIDATSAAGNYDNQFDLVKVGPKKLPQRSKVDVLRYGGTGGATPFANINNSPNAPLFNVPRFTRRIEQSIALYMPTPLIFNTHNLYEEVSLTKLAGKLMIGGAALSGAATASFQNLARGLGATGKVLAGLAAAATGAAGLTMGAAGSTLANPRSTVSSIAKLTGNPINPMNEIVFSSTQVRQFAFELLMAPRNEKESENIYAIIKTLRFHASPEINTNTYGLTWIPPAEFDITFFNKGSENMNMLRINTCILERIEVDYAPAAGTFSTFRNGHPVAIRLSLGFRELEPIHKQRVLQGF